MTMRERILAALQGRPHDRVPFVQYSGIAAPNEEIWARLGRGRMGILQWTSVHRVEHPNCRFEEEDFERNGQRWRRTTLHTPAGSIHEERAFEESYGSSSVRRHYLQEPADYDALLAYLRDHADGELHRGQFHPVGVPGHRLRGVVPALRGRAGVPGRNNRGWFGWTTLFLLTLKPGPAQCPSLVDEELFDLLPG